MPMKRTKTMGSERKPQIGQNDTMNLREGGHARREAAR